MNTEDFVQKKNFPKNKKDIEKVENYNKNNDDDYNFEDSINNKTLDQTMLKNEKIDEIDENKLISKEYKEEIERMVDKQFEIEFINLKKEYETKLEELLNEQEKLINKNEILNAKFYILERYLEHYCKKENIDYESLLED